MLVDDELELPESAVLLFPEDSPFDADSVLSELFPLDFEEPFA